jgi:hypothetical protein
MLFHPQTSWSGINILKQMKAHFTIMFLTEPKDLSILQKTVYEGRRTRSNKNHINNYNLLILSLQNSFLVTMAT